VLPEGGTVADGSLGSLYSVPSGKGGFVREAVRADKSVCGDLQGSLAKSLIFTPAVMRCRTEHGLATAFRPLRRLFERLLSAGHQLVYRIH
jgi:hypothetical protein